MRWNQRSGTPRYSRQASVVTNEPAGLLVDVIKIPYANISHLKCDTKQGFPGNGTSSARMRSRSARGIMEYSTNRKCRQIESSAPTMNPSRKGRDDV
jgi:hypothetical protein